MEIILIKNSSFHIMYISIDLLIYYVYQQINIALLNIVLYLSSAVKEPSDLLPARWQRSACKAKRAISCPLTRLIDRNKLRAIYIFLKNRNLSTNNFITSDFTIIEKILYRMHRKLFVEIFRLTIQNFPIHRNPDANVILNVVH